MKNKYLLVVFLCLYTLSYGQNSAFDPRLLLHFTEEELAHMPPAKIQNLQAYYCESYRIDASTDLNFDITQFDITIYESFRREEVDFVVVTETGVVITLLSRKSFVPQAKLMKQ